MFKQSCFFGFARIVRLKDDAETCADEAVNIARSGTDSQSATVPPVNDAERKAKAEMIAKGRKAKKLKRQANSEASAVRRCDLENIEVTAEEINDVMKELAKAASTSEPREIWHTPLYDIREEAYEEMKRPPFPENSNFRVRLNTFRDLWRRGYYLTCGLKFGCDYLAYEAIPG
ncbi:unnamed protein product, partial [Gongylonema pulchrum]|uniref:tRNA-intron lyase n=1 Tax=Gongylonema pulchrum TaxID=637853 RepID=A0A183DSM5_9BILA